MWIITYRGKPATLQTLCDVHGKAVWGDMNPESAIACRTKKATIESYLYYFGFSWSGREKEVQIREVEIK